MAVHGYITHAAANRRRFVALFAGYILGFEFVGAFALTPILLFADPAHWPLADPAGYALRYAAPIAAIAALVFGRICRGHARLVADLLMITPIERAEEPRFHAIAEAQCTALGIRVPRLGIIEVPETNALSVGDGPSRGMIAVTRGLLARLDDDELAAVLAHEASHIRNGDTRLLAANHALLRTAHLFQTHNVLRVQDDWRVLWLPLVFPPILVLMLVGGAVTMLSLRYARWAQRGVTQSRDHIADGDAVRVTHFPAALISAINALRGNGAFANCHFVAAHLFEAPADRHNSRHPGATERVATITRLAGDLAGETRVRRDTRAAASGAARHAGSVPTADAARYIFAYDRDGRPLERPPTPDLTFLWLMFADRPAYLRWQHASIAWHEWRETDRRNVFGVTQPMMGAIVAVIVLLAIVHWPADNQPAKLVRLFDPRTTADWIERNVVTAFRGHGARVDSAPASSTVNATTAPRASRAPAVSESDPGIDIGQYLFVALFAGAIMVAMYRRQIGTIIAHARGGHASTAVDARSVDAIAFRRPTPPAPAVRPAAVQPARPVFGRRGLTD